MAQSGTIGELAKALAKAQEVMKPAIKDTLGQVGSAKKKYADLASVWDACRAALTSNELSVVQHAEPDEKGSMLLTTVLLHSSGEWISGTERLPLDRPDAQAYGSCMTYARRYGLAAMVGVVTEDDDGAAASQPARDSRQQANSAPQQRPAPAQAARPNGGAQEPAKAPAHSYGWNAAREAFIKAACASTGRSLDRAAMMALCQELTSAKEPKRELAEYDEAQLRAMTAQLNDTTDPLAEEQAAAPKLPVEVPAQFK